MFAGGRWPCLCVRGRPHSFVDTPAPHPSVDHAPAPPTDWRPVCPELLTQPWQVHVRRTSAPVQDPTEAAQNFGYGDEEWIVPEGVDVEAEGVAPDGCPGHHDDDDLPAGEGPARTPRTRGRAAAASGEAAGRAPSSSKPARKRLRRNVSAESSEDEEEAEEAATSKPRKRLRRNAEADESCDSE